MRYKITQEEYNKIEELVYAALSAPNKQEAKRYIQQMYFVASDLGGAANNILHELIAETENASGKVADKYRKESFARMSLYKLRMFIEQEQSSKGGCRTD